MVRLRTRTGRPIAAEQLEQLRRSMTEFCFPLISLLQQLNGAGSFDIASLEDFQRGFHYDEIRIGQDQSAPPPLAQPDLPARTL